jgi:hypothetical protein
VGIDIHLRKVEIGQIGGGYRRKGGHRSGFGRIETGQIYM